MATLDTTDFMILGPAMASGNKVLDAIHALYFLPENFKLVLTGSETVDQSFFSRVQALIERNELSHRVTFSDGAIDPRAIILPNTSMGAANSITGDSPEALASAILHIARAAT